MNSFNSLHLSSITIDTPIGKMLAASTHKGICLLEFVEVEDRLKRQISQLEKYHSGKLETGTSPLLGQLEQELTEYFAGKRQSFDVPLDFQGTEFQQQSWQALLGIPYGETRSYQEQAIAIQKPKAARAVANANNRNRLPIIIPCHRVIGKNGNMRGYGGEIWRKEFLLKLEYAASLS